MGMWTGWILQGPSKLSDPGVNELMQLVREGFIATLQHGVHQRVHHVPSSCNVPRATAQHLLGTRLHGAAEGGTMEADGV
jgi:hypothetical protein